MDKGELYRGYIVWKDGTLNVMKTAKENELWQNRQQLEKHLRERLGRLQKELPMKDALRAEVEVVHTEILAADDSEAEGNEKPRDE